MKRVRRDLVLVVLINVAQQEGDKLYSRASCRSSGDRSGQRSGLPALLEHAPTEGLRRARVFDLDAPRFWQKPGQTNATPVSAFRHDDERVRRARSFLHQSRTHMTDVTRPAVDIVADANVSSQPVPDRLARSDRRLVSRSRMPPPRVTTRDESQVPHLLRAIARDVPDLLRLRYASPHPRHRDTIARKRASRSRRPRATRSSSRSIWRQRHARKMIPVRVQNTSNAPNRLIGAIRAHDVDRHHRGISGQTNASSMRCLSFAKWSSCRSSRSGIALPRPFTPALKLKSEFGGREKRKAHGAARAR